jgi:hypothetical protein
LEVRIKLSLGVSICLSWDSQSLHCQKVSLDSQENFDSLKKFISTIEKFWSCLDATFQSQKSILTILTVSTKISTRPSLHWKSLGFKNLDRDGKRACLDSWENLDKYQKLTLTDREVLISSWLVSTVETPKLKSNSPV